MVRAMYQLDQWGARSEVRARWLQAGASQLEALLSRFVEAFELPFDLGIWRLSLGVMATEGLQSLDAVHIATARTYGLRYLAAVDDDFERCADVQFWLIRDP